MAAASYSRRTGASNSCITLPRALDIFFPLCPHPGQGVGLNHAAFFLQSCTDLGQPFNCLQGSRLLVLLAFLGQVLLYDLSHQVRDAPPFLLGDLGQGLMLLGFE